MAINCFRFLGCETLEDVDKITMREYLLRMKACRLRRVDGEMKLHKQAFLNLAVKATKKIGKNKEKPLYERFSDFYDYEKEIEQALKDIDEKQEKSTFSELSKHLKRQEKEKRGG